MKAIAYNYSYKYTIKIVRQRGYIYMSINLYYITN